MAGPSSFHSSPTMGGELKEYEVKDLLVYVSKAANANRKNTILYASMYVHALKHTDIRVVHRSLFERKDCLGIYWGTGAISMSPTTPAEPLYIQFPDTETLNLWIVLLRSYGMPEVYGRSINPHEGGLYRMWRQVELTCVSGRNLGTSRSPDDLGYVDPDETLDMDVYCDLWINGILCGKTAVRKGVGSPDWQESFTFPDLPPFETLDIQVLREKKLLKPVLIGTVTIPLMNVRRGDLVEGCFPVMSPHHSIGLICGELKLKIRVVEEIILPSSAYSTVERALSSKNTLEWISELDTKLSIKNVSSDLVAFALAKNKIVDDIKHLANREVDGSEHWNTVLTKTLEIFMATEGAAFLEASVGRVLRRLCSDKVVIETDPGRSGKSSKQTEKSVELLVQCCQELWKSIYDAREKCPVAMRRLFCHIRTLIETRYDVAKYRYSDLPWQGVSAFLFLRFFTPAILRPHVYGFWLGMCEEPVQRSLTLIAKVMSSLANLNTTTNLSTREEFPRVKDFLTETLPMMVNYLSFVSTDPSEIPQSPQTTSAAGGRSRLRVHHGFYSKKASLPLLYRESIPELPQMLDLGRHLAILTSVVVRHTRLHLPARIGAPSEHEFDAFCQTCLQVEEMALMRVSKMAGRSRAGEQYTHTPQGFKRIVREPEAFRKLVYRPFTWYCGDWGNLPQALAPFAAPSPPLGVDRLRPLAEGSRSRAPFTNSGRDLSPILA
ncbi:hypothetical protein PHLGIDRAFT_21262 [Phlebiopsis gigantea 11061_1 CR5-6]|uniref:Uncharacterized protein n=1 Tax=Phlebiopsis gigantea (strain 11061_1 CR5-6) TaxID=745531 RepID=A0A0C3PVM6_PHLG1|nr:hypothetical protein PHLGIDRAFT_21262 [Phlebiopsis gigantea 11061_1 CR5-6]